MKGPIHSSVCGFLLAQLFTSAFAAEVLITDGVLKAAIWQALGKAEPVGSLTEEDMLQLTALDARTRNVRTLNGLGAAQNLTTLNLSGTQLTSLTLPEELTSLTKLNLGSNPLKNVALSKTLAENNLKLVTDLRLQGVVITLLWPPPILAGGQLTSVDFFFRLTASPGTYQIQVTSDLLQWTHLNSVTVPESGSVTVSDSLANSRPYRFYRAISTK